MKLDFSALKSQKNLLAFSAGIDSSALFFLLLDANIPFDIALVNYQSRETSDAEAAYAKELAKRFHKEVYILQSSLAEQNIEAHARKIRYDFFESLIEMHGYTTLITGHQLNDQLEWFLMQLTKGAGSLELLGMRKLQKQKNYLLCKPLLEVTKASLEAYLKEHNHKYFFDQSNDDQSLTRNYFRHNFSDKLLDSYGRGIAQSFSFLEEDAQQLLEESKIQIFEELTVITAKSERSLLYLIDKDLKQRGYILSYPQREEIIKQKSITIGGKFHIEIEDKKAFIVPVIEELTMPKTFKESCRKAKVPLKIRSYLFSRDIEISFLL